MEGRMTVRSRRDFLGTTAGASAFAIAGAAGLRPAHAQFPERNLTLIVPYGAGGGTDITARLLARDLEPVLGKAVTVENRAGGGGWIGWGALAAAKPDGYTLGYLNVPSMYAGYLDPQIGRKERLESFTPIINHVIDYNIWAVKADSPFRTVKDVVDAARKQPDTITVSAFGAGSDDHIAILGMQAETGTRFIVIHSKSTAEAKTQALGGHIHVLGANISEVAEEVRAGQFRMLGVMAPGRSRFLPDASTFKEQGFNQVWSVTRGIAAPANLAKDAEARLSAALSQVINSKEHQARAEKLSLEPLVIQGEDYRKFLKDNEQATKKLMNW
jgi:tripartite-type tricarboxylate transporter receptor subunit TctC